MADKYPVGNQLIPYGTPLHITELFLQILKLTFADFPDGHPYKFIEDDFERTGIAFDVVLNKESGIYGKKPLVVVSRGMQSMNSNFLGDLATSSPQVSFQRGSNIYGASINLHILSRVKAEVEIIGQLVFSAVMLCRTHFPSQTGLHMLQSGVLSEVSRMDDDDAMFVCHADFNYVGQYIWAQSRNDPLLRHVQVAVGKIERD